MGRVLSVVIVALVLGGILVPAALASASREERLVSFLDETPLEGSSLAGVRVLETFPFAGVARVEGTGNALARLATLPNVAGVYQPEPLTFQLERSRAVVNADAPHGAVDWPRGGNTTIALVDSGIDGSHPAFDGRILASVRVSKGGSVVAGSGDDDGHGTHIAGILAGDGDGSRDGRLHGIAPESRLVAVDISDAFTTTTALRAFEWVHDHHEEYNIRVVSNSWGREREDAAYDRDDPVIRASDALVADGLVVVFSAGNRGRDGASTLTPEAMNPNIIAVGSASASGRVDAYSSRGPALDGNGEPLSWVKPDLAAPGTGIVSTRTSAHTPSAPRSDEDRYYTVMNGTSMAAPHVAAAAALLLDADPSLSPARVAALLTTTARDIESKGADPLTGHGMLDISAALAALRALDGSSQTIVVERPIPIHVDGSVTALEGRVVLAGGSVRAPPEDAVTIPFAAPASTTRVDLFLNWSGTGSFRVELEMPDGSRTPFQTARTQSLHLAMPIHPGAYRVIVHATGVAVNSPFVLDGIVVVEEERVLEVPTELHAREYAPSGGFFETRSGARAFLDVPGDMHALALFGSVGVLAGLAFTARRRFK